MYDININRELCFVPWVKAEVRSWSCRARMELERGRPKITREKQRTEISLSVTAPTVKYIDCH